MRVSGSLIEAKLMADDVAMKAGRASCAALRDERETLMSDWGDLVASQDFVQIGIRAKRMAEISRELARLGG